MWDRFSANETTDRVVSVVTHDATLDAMMLEKDDTAVFVSIPPVTSITLALQSGFVQGYNVLCSPIISPTPLKTSISTKASKYPRNPNNQKPRVNANQQNGRPKFRR